MKPAVIDRLCGIALPYNKTTRSRVDGAYEKVPPQDINVTDDCFVNAAIHDTVQPAVVATVQDGSLRLFNDASVGLCFQFDIHSTSRGLGTRAMLRDFASLGGVGASVLFTGLKRDIGNDGIAVVRHACIGHITVAPADSVAYPAALCWLESDPIDSMEPHLRNARLRWQIAKYGNECPEPRRKAKAKKVQEPFLIDGIPYMAWLARERSAGRIKDYQLLSPNAAAAKYGFALPSYLNKARAFGFGFR